MSEEIEELKVAGTTLIPLPKSTSLQPTATNTTTPTYAQVTQTNASTTVTSTTTVTESSVQANTIPPAQPPAPQPDYIGKVLDTVATTLQAMEKSQTLMSQTLLASTKRTSTPCTTPTYY